VSEPVAASVDTTERSGAIDATGGLGGKGCLAPVRGGVP
jgi:hypothetical protein